MRIGTWNLAGRWGARHLEFLTSLDCDLLLLTEVPSNLRLLLYELHHTAGFMAPNRWWAAVASRIGLSPLPDPHGASAMAKVGQLRVCSSILPWRTCGFDHPWAGTSTAEKTANSVAVIEQAHPEIWGGDWNHSLSGREYVGSLLGRQHILEAVTRLGLVAPTSDLPHQIDGLVSIDHVAIPENIAATTAERRSAVVGRVALSDHDAYVVTAESF